MKLKKTEIAETAAAPTTGAAIADRFRLDVPEEQPKASGSVATLLGALAALAAAAMIGAAAALMYVNWGEVQGL